MGTLIDEDLETLVLSRIESGLSGVIQSWQAKFLRSWSDATVFPWEHTRTLRQDSDLKFFAGLKNYLVLPDQSLPDIFLVAEGTVDRFFFQNLQLFPAISTDLCLCFSCRFRTSCADVCQRARSREIKLTCCMAKNHSPVFSIYKDSSLCSGNRSIANCSGNRSIAHR